MSKSIVLLLAALSFVALPVADAAPQGESWRYYRPGNTGIQGDYNEAVWIDANGDPTIGGYDPGFEEGGFAKFVQAENRWVNYSNVDYPVIGHPDTTGTSRVSDIVADASGKLWMSTWRGALRFDPAVGAPSLVNFASANAALLEGGARDLDIAPDGTLWFALTGFGGAQGGLLRYTPSTDTWKLWTGGATPVGGNNWPQLVWSVRYVSIQPKPAGGYIVWCDSENSSAIVSFDTATQTFTNQDFTYTLGSMLELPGKDCVDDAGNLWMRRFAGFVGNNATFNLDYRRPDGTWVTPAQVALPAIAPPIWAFRAFGDRQALLVDGNSAVSRFDGANWNDYGIWRPGAYTYDVNIDAQGSVWTCGIGGAARRDPLTGAWQRYRVSNTSQFDSFNSDLSVGRNGEVYASANAGTGIGGMVGFDGVRWTGFDNAQYGLGHPWPFPTDNSNAVFVRPSNGHVAVNPSFSGVREWTGSQFVTLSTNGKIVDFAEDSLNRLWALGEYFDLKYHDGASWTSVGITAWGNRMQKDPERPGTVWAATGHELLRTDGAYRFSRQIQDFPELTTQSDTFSGLAAAPGGIAWIGATVQYGAGGTGGALIRVDANTGGYQMLRYDQGWPLPGKYVQPLAVTPDGRVWMQYDTDYLTAQRGLCWYDGTNVGVYPAPPNGEPQWGGLPHAQIEALDVRMLPYGYELWMGCMSRGLAVLTVHQGAPGTVLCSGDDPGANCPCGNIPSAGSHSGCRNSTNFGATLRASGTASVANDDLRLTSAGLPVNKAGLVLVGPNASGGLPFHAGLLCLAPPVRRLQGANSGAGGSFAHGPGLCAYAATHFAEPWRIGVGTQWIFQSWFRDTSGPCGAANTSNALAVTFVP